MNRNNLSTAKELYDRFMGYAHFSRKMYPDDKHIAYLFKLEAIQYAVIICHIENVTILN